jgi:hypothetical protein
VQRLAPGMDMGLRMIMETLVHGRAAADQRLYSRLRVLKTLWDIAGPGANIALGRSGLTARHVLSLGRAWKKVFSGLSLVSA